MAFSLTRFLDGFHGDYLTDRIIRLYTVLLFLIIAVTMSVRFEQPDAMVCWTPAYFEGTHNVFTHATCKGNAGVYLMPSRTAGRTLLVPGDFEAVNIKKLWRLPLVIAAQSLLFLLPWLLWKLLSGAFCNLNAVVREAANANNFGISVAGQLNKLLNHPCSIIGEVGGGYLLCITYLITKMGYWAICLAQMSILAKFLEFNFFTYRLRHDFSEPYSYFQLIPVTERNQSTGDIINITLTTRTVIPFPRDVLCDFQIRQMGNVHRHTVQCTLNMCESIETYLNIIWVWLIILLVITALSGMAHFVKSILWFVGPKSFKRRFLERKLYGMQSFYASSKSAVDKFAARYLKPDCFFIVGMIEENGSTNAASLALGEMWNEFLRSSKISTGGESQPLHTSMQQPYHHQQQPSNVGPVMAGAAATPYKRPTSTASPAGPYSEVQALIKDAESNI